MNIGMVGIITMYPKCKKYDIEVKRKLWKSVFTVRPLLTNMLKEGVRIVITVHTVHDLLLVPFVTGDR